MDGGSAFVLLRRTMADERWTEWTKWTEARGIEGRGIAPGVESGGEPPAAAAVQGRGWAAPEWGGSSPRHPCCDGSGWIGAGVSAGCSDEAPPSLLRSFSCSFPASRCSGTRRTARRFASRLPAHPASSSCRFPRSDPAPNRTVRRAALCPRPPTA